MPMNLYHTNSYLVINAGLPRCLPDKVHVFVAPAKILIQAERHPDEEPIHEERTYSLAQASVAAPFEYLSLPLNVMWGFAIWRVVPTLLTWAGACLTLLSGLSLCVESEQQLGLKGLAPRKRAE